MSRKIRSDPSSNPIKPHQIKNQKRKKTTHQPSYPIPHPNTLDALLTGNATTFPPTTGLDPADNPALATRENDLLAPTVGWMACLRARAVDVRRDIFFRKCLLFLLGRRVGVNAGGWGGVSGLGDVYRCGVRVFVG